MEFDFNTYVKKLVKKEEINPSINLFFKKISSVDNKYPRNYALIKKKPL